MSGVSPKSRVAWVTGASSGLGLAIATTLAERGWKVALSSRDSMALDSACREIGRDVMAVPADVTQADALLSVVSRIGERLGPVGVLVANAGMNIPSRAWGDVSARDFAKVTDANLNGVFNSIAAVLPPMRDRGGGRIVLISSFAGWHVTPQPGPAYTASKMALLGLAESLSMAEMRHRIVATALCPGEVATPAMQRRVPPPAPEVLARMLQPEDIAAAVAFIVEQPDRVAVNELVLTPRWNNAYNRIPGPPPSDGEIPSKTG